MAGRIDWEGRIGRRLKLRDLHVYFAVVQCGSMAKAATQLGVSQPTVSEIIADLEHTFGVRLLDRVARGVEPTIYGNALLKRGIAAFDELKQSARDIAFLADPTVGELKIGCAESIAAAVLPTIIERFGQQYPRVVVHVDDVPSPALALLRDRKHDLIMARTVRPLGDEADFNVEILFDDQLIVAADPRSRWARRRKIDLAELDLQYSGNGRQGTRTATLRHRRCGELLLQQGIQLSIAKHAMHSHILTQGALELPTGALQHQDAAHVVRVHLGQDTIQLAPIALDYEG